MDRLFNIVLPHALWAGLANTYFASKVYSCAVIMGTFPALVDVNHSTPTSTLSDYDTIDDYY